MSQTPLDLTEVQTETNPPSEYSAGSIQVLKGLEGVRKRPAMYIGDTGINGLHELIKEIVNNSIDEAMAGRCTRIDVDVLEDGSVRITDDGYGIPVDYHKGEGISYNIKKIGGVLWQI